MPRRTQQTLYDKDEVDARFAGLDLDDIRKMMAERLKEQHEQHHGGNKWIGTGGTSAFGHSGYSRRASAWADRAKTGARCRWRNSGITAISATMRSSRSGSSRWLLKKLRLLSCREDGPKTELNVEKTIEKTCDEGGRLELVMERPRKNRRKLLLLMDSGRVRCGHMRICATGCSRRSNSRPILRI